MENPTNIIFVDDNPSDIRLVKYALSQVDEDITLNTYKSGQAFLDQLSDIYPASVGCILLDINMPFVSGFEVMEALRADEDYRYIPIIIFTSTDTNEERTRAYQNGANAYVVKPLEVDKLIDAMNGIVQFWIKTNGRAL